MAKHGPTSSRVTLRSCPRATTYPTSFLFLFQILKRDHLMATMSQGSNLVLLSIASEVQGIEIWPQETTLYRAVRDRFWSM